ncbi:MAG: tetratricopeptide repeat protein [Gemmataceae bacterium]
MDDRIDRLHDQAIDAIEQGNAELAERLTRRLIAAIEARAERTRALRVLLAQTYYNLGTLLSETNQSAESRAPYHQALALVRELVAEEPTPDERNLLGQASFNLGNSHLAGDELAAALPAFRDAAEAWEPLAEEFPDEPQYRHDLARSLFNRGYVHRMLRQDEDAQVCFRHAVTVWEGLIESVEDNPAWRFDAGRGCFSLGEIHREADRPDDARTQFRQAVEHMARLVQRTPDWPDALRLVQVFHNTHCQTLANQGHQSAIPAALSDMVDVLDAASDALPSDRPEQLVLARIAHVQAHQLAQFADQAEATEDAYRRAVALAERYREGAPDDADGRDALAAIQFDLGMHLRAQMKSDAAEAAYAQARQHLEALLVERPDDADLQGRMAGVHNNLGILYLDTGRLRRADAAYRAALRIREGIARRNPDGLDNRVFLGGTLCNLGHVVRKRGRRDEAIGLYNRAIGEMQRAKAAPGAGSLVPSFMHNAQEGREHAIDPPPPPRDVGVSTATMAWRPAGPPPALATPGVPADRPEEALAHLAGAPGDPTVQLDRADLLRSLGRADEALAEVDRVLAAEPNRPDAWFVRGLILGRFLTPQGGEMEPFERDRNAEAVAAFDRCLEAMPDNAACWRYRGRVSVARRPCGAGRVPGAGVDARSGQHRRATRRRDVSGRVPPRPVLGRLRRGAGVVRGGGPAAARRRRRLVRPGRSFDGIDARLRADGAERLCPSDDAAPRRRRGLVSGRPPGLRWRPTETRHRQPAPVPRSRFDAAGAGPREEMAELLDEIG